MTTRLYSRRSCKRRATESSSSHRKMVLDVDLNAYPDVTLGPFNFGEPPAQGNSTLLLPVQGTERQEGLANEPIDVEAIEEEVTLLSSLQGFPQTRNQPQRNLPVTVELDEDDVVHTASSGSTIEDPITVLALNTYWKREIVPSKRTIINCEAYENLESGPNAKKKNVADIPEPQMLAPKEPTFNCTVCWGALVDATSTPCGHIFCQKCIYAAIKAQKKCPTCRRGITVRSTHRVYLPSSS